MSFIDCHICNSTHVNDKFTAEDLKIAVRDKSNGAIHKGTPITKNGYVRIELDSALNKLSQEQEKKYPITVILYSTKAFPMGEVQRVNSTLRRGEKGKTIDIIVNFPVYQSVKVKLMVRFISDQGRTAAKNLMLDIDMPPPKLDGKVSAKTSEGYHFLKQKKQTNAQGYVEFTLPFWNTPFSIAYLDPRNNQKYIHVKRITPKKDGNSFYIDIDIPKEKPPKNKLIQIQPLGYIFAQKQKRLSKSLKKRRFN